MGYIITIEIDRLEDLHDAVYELGLVADAHESARKLILREREIWDYEYSESFVGENIIQLSWK